MESPGIRVQLCGRVAIDLGGRRVEHSLPGRQGRLLFVYLAIHRLRAVTRDELAEAVWPDGPPTAWDSALNALLSKLRRLLGADLVPARGDPRLVLPTAAWVDLEAARDAVHRAESAVALEDWPRAWGAAQVTMFTARRGFLPGGDVTWAEEIRRQLAELYLRALEAYALAALGLGGPELATAERAGREMVTTAPSTNAATDWRCGPWSPAATTPRRCGATRSCAACSATSSASARAPRPKSCIPRSCAGPGLPSNHCSHSSTVVSPTVAPTEVADRKIVRLDRIVGHWHLASRSPRQ